MKKRLVVDVLIDDSITEAEILNRVDDVLADCALGPSDFTDFDFDYDSQLTFEDDDPEEVETVTGTPWKPEPGTALDYIYRKKKYESCQGEDFKKKLEEGNKLKKALLATAMATGLIGTTPKMYAKAPKTSKGQQTTIALDSNKEIEKVDLGSIKTYSGVVAQEYVPMIRKFIEEYLEDTKKEIVDGSFIKMTKSNITDSLSSLFPDSSDEEIENEVDGMFIMAFRGAKIKISSEVVPVFSKGWRDTAALFVKK